MTIAQSFIAKAGRGHARQRQEALDLGKKLLVHVQPYTVCYATPSSHGVLKHHLHAPRRWCVAAHMHQADFEQVLADIRKRVAAAVKASGLGAKPFAKQNGMGETVVRDLLKAHNKDVQLSTLMKIAAGAEWPLLDLLPDELTTERPAAPTEDDLRRAILEALPGMRSGSPDTRAAYLAGTVAQLLKLPAGRIATLPDQPQPADREEGAPPPSTTS